MDGQVGPNEPIDTDQFFSDVTFWAMAVRSLRRLVLVNPEYESRCKEMIRIRGLDPVFTVVPNPYIPKDKAYLIDRDMADQYGRIFLGGPGRGEFTIPADLDTEEEGS